MLKDVKIFGRDVCVYINGEWYADEEIGKYLLDESEFENDVDEMVLEFVTEFGEMVRSIEFRSIVVYKGTTYHVIFDRHGNVCDYTVI